MRVRVKVRVKIKLRVRIKVRVRDWIAIKGNVYTIVCQSCPLCDFPGRKNERKHFNIRTPTQIHTLIVISIYLPSHNTDTLIHPHPTHTKAYTKHVCFMCVVRGLSVIS